MNMESNEKNNNDAFPEVTSLLKELQSLRDQLTAYEKRIEELDNKVWQQEEQLATEKLHAKHLNEKIRQLEEKENNKDGYPLTNEDFEY